MLKEIQAVGSAFFPKKKKIPKQASLLYKYSTERNDDGGVAKGGDAMYPLPLLYPGSHHRSMASSELAPLALAVHGESVLGRSGGGSPNLHKECERGSELR